MSASTLRSIFGLSGLAAAAIGLWLWWPPAALMTVGAITFGMAVFGELRAQTPPGETNDGSNG